jgi:hypothetical protein
MPDYPSTPPPKSPSPVTVPRSSSLPRLASSKLFLPTQNEASAISTRGHHLPSLLNSARRPSTIRSSERRGSDTDDEDLEAYRNGLMMPYDRDSDRRSSIGAHVLNTPQMRSQRLIGNSNPRYKWEKYYKTEEELKGMKKPIREYYERNNQLLQHYLYIDRLLDSSRTTSFKSTRILNPAPSRSPLPLPKSLRLSAPHSLLLPATVQTVQTHLVITARTGEVVRRVV